MLYYAIMRKWWKRPHIIGTGAYILFKLIALTLRVKVERHSAVDAKNAYLFAFWHGNQLLPSLVMPGLHQSAMYALVSSSRDGAMLANYLQKCGFGIIRGSSRNNNTAALMQLREKFRDGASVGVGVDGPIGPLYSVKPGIVFLAQKYGATIIPLGSAYSRNWTFTKAWDKFELPKPFARAIFVMGEPYMVASGMSVEEASAELAQRIHAVQARAMDLIR